MRATDEAVVMGCGHALGELVSSAEGTSYCAACEREGRAREDAMAWGSGKTGRTEHSGAKNGGGYWGKREWAKRASSVVRRRVRRALERSGEQADQERG